MISDHPSDPETAAATTLAMRPPSRSLPLLLCLPYAGAGTNVFQDWPRHHERLAEVVPLTLPGREKRFLELAHTRIERAAEDLLQQTLRIVSAARSVLIFGHSMGAVLAYELGRQLIAQSGLTPKRLIVSGAPAPAVPRRTRASGLPDQEFVAQVRELAGYSHPALDDPEMRELVLPTLRADVELHEGYVGKAEPIAVPITVMRGRDDQLVSREHALLWRTATQCACEYVEIDGDHMGVFERPESLTAVIAAHAPSYVPAGHQESTRCD